MYTKGFSIYLTYLFTTVLVCLFKSDFTYFSPVFVLCNQDCVLVIFHSKQQEYLQGVRDVARGVLRCLGTPPPPLGNFSSFF